MSQRVIVSALLIAIAVVGVALWFKQTTQPQSPAVASQPTEEMGAGGPGSGDMAGGPPGGDMGGGMPPGAAGGGPHGEAMSPGIAWTAPARWAPQGERPMRVATYSIPAAGGDPEGAECAVFYFGPNQGGSVDDNIARWVGQFSEPGEPVRSRKTVHGLEVARVQVDGTFLAPSGPTMEPTAQKQNHRLLGGIVSGPNGLVFFKLVGPLKTVEAATRDFDRLLESVKKQ